ncbi:zinc-binding dehydrogenase [Catenulispora rubra]|uniref:zinc-binding dehydrogenase n=1 Tax=Catenulispora rubra TaxID=280293 RepID=UPI0018921502|nr:zinc-binding dehydrogenase [Catenulispora rubra]
MAPTGMLTTPAGLSQRRSIIRHERGRAAATLRVSATGVAVCRDCRYWGEHSLAPLSFRGASYSGVFTLLPLLTGKHRAHHGNALAAAAELVDRGLITPIVDPTPYHLGTVAEAHQAVASGSRRGKVAVSVDVGAGSVGPEGGSAS